MRFASLGSGSRGNATLVEHKGTCLLVDCGFSLRETQRRLEAVAKCAEDIQAIIITHEHADHINGVGALSRKFGISVYATRGTFYNAKLEDVHEKVFINPHLGFSINDLHVQPFPVPHDANEPCQLVIGDGDKRLGMLTDTGSSTKCIEEALYGCDALLLECNHELAWLEAGDYPRVLKERVGGAYGHLNNAQAAQLLKAVASPRLQHIAAAHLSEKHNTPQRVRRHLSAALDCEADWIAIADQAHGLDWRCIL